MPLKHLCLLLLLTLPLHSFAQNAVPVATHGITETDGLTVTVELGGDGARGGGQMLLVFEMRDGRTRKFDLNRSRAEWGGGSTHRLEISVVPPIRYADVTRMGIEWHGSQGDLLQEQDDVDIRRVTVISRSRGANSERMNNLQVNVGQIGSVRLDNDQMYWAGGIRAEVLAPALCAADRDCDDGRYCNGPERCQPSNPAANAFGCMLAAAPCGPGAACNESAQRCDVSCPDNDGDGHTAQHCGGDDCDDNDANRYPGNIEVADRADHDEDCDVNTHGLSRGAASAQICDGRDRVVLVDAVEQITRSRCVPGTVCVQQPNGSGVCMTEPPGYQAPSAAALPSGPQQARPARPGRTIHWTRERTRTAVRRQASRTF